jgi:hypothetical protein
LPAVLRPGHQRVDNQFHQPLAAKVVGHLPVHDPLREALNDRRLPHARLADQHRVVLLAPGQDLDDGFDLRSPADHRIQLPLLRQRGDVAAVLVEVGRVGFALEPPLLRAFADHSDRLLPQRLWREPVPPQQFRRQAVLFLGQPDQQVLGANVVMTQVPRRLERRLERPLHSRRNPDLLPVGFPVPAPPPRTDLLHLPLELVGRDLEAPEDRLHDVVVRQRVQHVLRIDFVAAPFDRGARGLLEDLLCLLAERIGQVYGFAIAAGSSSRIRVRFPAKAAPAKTLILASEERP